MTRIDKVIATEKPVKATTTTTTTSEGASAGKEVCGQYADGKAAQVWQKYIGDQNERTGFYKEHLIRLLTENNVKTVFDVACGKG